jgi:hypothetical protein
MLKAIVTTTINPPTKALKKFIKIAERDDWTVIIIGDKKTPHDDYLALCAKHPCLAYMTPQKQDSKYHELSEAIGWNCIQRRNIGVVHAYNLGAEVIAVVDDDNIPYDNWGVAPLLALGNQPLVAVVQSPDLVFDPMQGSNRPDLWHRGFPVQLLKERSRATYIGHQQVARCLVYADFWDGEPDVDAICRIAKGPFDCKFTHEPFAGTAPGPFNSQNTFLHRDVIPYYCLFPHIGRMDDIWASYVVQKYFPGCVVYGAASVYQERNVHNFVKDLDAELIGYHDTLRLVQELYEPTGDDPMSWINLLPFESAKAYRLFQDALKVDLSTGTPQDDRPQN